MMVKRLTTLALLVIVTASMGCAKMTTTHKWMAGGAAAGAAIGGIWGADGSGLLNAGEGAAIGAVTGATAGALVGEAMEQNDMECLHTKTIQEKEAEIAKLQEANRKLATEKQSLEEELKVAKRKIEDLNGQVANLTDELAKCKGSRIELTFEAGILFKPGSKVLSDKGKAALDTAVAKIKSAYDGKYVMVEGHTDSDPIKASNWQTNWELGSGRSLAVLHYLISKGIDPAKCAASTFSQYKPVADNGTKDGKAKNRRAVIVINSGWPMF